MVESQQDRGRERTSPLQLQRWLQVPARTSPHTNTTFKERVSGTTPCPELHEGLPLTCPLPTPQYPSLRSFVLSLSPKTCVPALPGERWRGLNEGFEAQTHSSEHQVEASKLRQERSPGVWAAGVWGPQGCGREGKFQVSV